MKTRRLWPILVILTLLLGLPCRPAQLLAAAQQAALPAGFRAIPLAGILGEQASHVVDARMLQGDTCVLSLQSPETGLMSVAVIDIASQLPVQPIPVPDAGYLHRQGWRDNQYWLLFGPQNLGDPSGPRDMIQVLVGQDGGISMISLPPGQMDMPGGQTSIQEEDGSLYALHRATGQRELLLQGVPDAWSAGRTGATYQMFQAYQPAPDEPGYNGLDAYGQPLPLSLPIDEAAFQEHAIWLWRDYHVYAPLDAQRFVYSVSGWEWGAGFGIYDLATRSNHRFTGQGWLMGMVGRQLYGSGLQVDGDSYARSPLPDSVAAQFDFISDSLDVLLSYALSPDGRLLALVSSDPEEEPVSSLTLTDMVSGAVLRQQQLMIPDVEDLRLSFSGNSQLLLLTRMDSQPGLLYLIDL